MFKYETIADDYKKQIREGNLKPGDKIPCGKDIAKDYNVSRATVSKAMDILKSDGLISRTRKKGTIILDSTQQVQQAQGRSQVPEISLSTSEPIKQAALIIPKASDTFAMNVISGVRDALAKEGYYLHVIISENAEGESRMLQTARDLKCGGIILFPCDQRYYSDALLYMKLEKFPIILIDRLFPGVDLDYVINDHQDEGYMCADYLIQNGCTNIIFVTNTLRSSYSNSHRIGGIRKAIENRNPNDISLSILDNVAFNAGPDDIAQQIRDLAIGTSEYGFITSEIHTSMLINEYLTQNKINPFSRLVAMDGLMPSGFSNFEFLPHLNQHEYKMGNQAAKILLQKISNPSTPYQHIKMKADLVIPDMSYSIET